MKTLALLTTLFTLALTARAETAVSLRYIVYDLTNGTVTEPTTTAPTDINGGYFVDKMLFVSNGSDYYMGVFEVTCAQADYLFDNAPKSEEKYAYTVLQGYDFTISKNCPNLFVPTPTEWQTYAAGDKVEYVNTYKSILSGSQSISAWRPTESAYVANAHGVYDIFGNAAEYTTDGKYYGGSATDAEPHFKDWTTETAWADDDTTHLVFNTYSLRGVRLVYRPPATQTYSVTVKVNATTVQEYTDIKPGATVTYEVPVPEGYRLDATAPTVVPEGLAITDQTFTMPEQAVTVTYTATKFANVSVTGAAVSNAQPLAGETVTFTPNLPSPPNCFQSWKLPEGWTGTTDAETNALTVTIPDDIDPGEEVAFAANYQTYPRVLVYGGTVEVKEGQDLGSGYYTPGTKLWLTANTVPYYDFAGWAITGVEEPNTTSSFTVGAYGTTTTYTATYEASGDNSTPTSPYVTLIGERAVGGGYAARATLGYTAFTEPTETKTADGNNFRYYGATKVESDYVTFDLVKKTVSYLASGSMNTETNKTSNLVLKRTELAGVNPYYIAIFETTIAQREYLRVLGEDDKYDEANIEDTMPFQDWNVDASSSVFTELKGRFGAYEIVPKLPSKDQILGIRTAYEAVNGITDQEKKDNPLTWNLSGAGHINNVTTYGDFRIKESMIVCGRTYAQGPLAVGSKSADPYGFYDLWGNYYERLLNSGNNGWAGCYQYGAVLANLEAPNDTPSNCLGFRTAIEMLPQVGVTIAGIDTPFKVITGQEITLQPQIQKGKKFTAWTADTEAQPVAAGDGTFTYTVTETVTLTPEFDEAEETIALSLTGCDGPATALPGQKLNLYLDPTQKVADVTVTPSGAATVGTAVNGLLPVEFANPAMADTVSITVTYEGAPGYLFRIQ